ncbi:helix-turn-helix transcriptional regulator [Micromonospora wenchangensis]|uniref:helix-turn-helix transcriptional regulator n=1 Tax=Micromonospora wenchangensis TaxID=1185415 RepID=UPI003817F9B5
MSDAWPLTGRSEELRVVDASIRGARGVVLAGVAGVGKTRLAREVLAIAQRRGVVGRWVTGSACARTTPLGAFASVLPSVGSDPLQMLGQAAKALLSGAGRAGTLVVVDDGHLLDDVSATLLHHLVTATAATVVVTVRSDVPAPDAVMATWKDAHLERFELVPLPEVETAALLEAALGGPLQPKAADQMWRLSQGNPLYLRELVTGGRASGWLEERSGVWCCMGTLAVPSTLVELIESRMGGLTEPVRDVVDLLAFAGVMDVEVLSQLTGAPALEQAEVSGLISVVSDGRRLSTSLAHPLYGEVRQARVGMLRARRLRGLIVRALTEHGLHSVDDELRCAALMVDSDLRADPALLTRAATRSAQLLDLPLALRLARSSVAAGGGFEARAVLAHALSMHGRGTEADDELLVLAELAGDDIQRAWVAAVRAANLFFDLNRPTEAETVLGNALDDVADATANQLLLSLHAVFEGLLARSAVAIQVGRAVLDAPGVAPNAAFLAAWGLTSAYGVAGRTSAMRPAAAAARRAAISFDTAILRFNVAELELMALRLAGHISEAVDVAARCRRDAASLPGVPQFYASALTGQAALACGRLAETIRRMREALAGFTLVDPGGRVFDCLLWLTHAMAMSGDARSAERALSELDERVQTGYAYRRPDVALARAWVAAANGAIVQAVGLARKAADGAAADGMPAHEVCALETAVRFGDRHAAERLSGLEAQVDGPRVGIAVRYASALAANDGWMLQAVSTGLEEMGDLAAAADAAAQAVAAHTKANRLDAAQVCAARVHLLAQRCQGARTPAIISVVRPLAITAREREIITLAAHGLSNREIAARLGVSVRTVEGHVYRAGAKLGTTRRADFARLLWGHP